MTLTIELSPHDEARLTAQARQQGLELTELARRIVVEHISDAERDLALFAEWDEEDAALTPEKRAEDARVWEAFEKGVNETRQSLGMRQL